ncbi:MAG: F0F1 ATP synthase subunit gamma [Gammaproteobacteria bacterium]|nr:F0F1 ATP synthase subunit gamma [Gammaproteobacteria bacterium]
MDSVSTLRRRIGNLDDLRLVVKTMKAMAGAGMHEFEQTRQALEAYSSTVVGALSVALKTAGGMPMPAPPRTTGTGVIVIGTDLGMVGQFNDYLVQQLQAAGTTLKPATAVWVVGERAAEALRQSGHAIAAVYPAPQSASAIAPLVSRLLADIDSERGANATVAVTMVFNKVTSGAEVAPAQLRLLPASGSWREDARRCAWPPASQPEMLHLDAGTLNTLVAEYVFIRLYEAVVQSCLAENTARLAAMQRAGKNIDDRGRDLTLSFNRLRQGTIDAELFDLIGGFAALSDVQVRAD